MWNAFFIFFEKGQFKIATPDGSNAVVAAQKLSLLISVYAIQAVRIEILLDLIPM